MRDAVRFHRTWLFVLYCVLVTMPNNLFAEQETDEFVLSTYEVDDLIIDIQDHPYSDSFYGKTSSNRAGRDFGGGGGLSGGGGGMVSLPTPGQQHSAKNPASITMDDLMRVILSTVDSQSWRENQLKTGEGEIQPIGSALVVWQKRSVQRQIGVMLDQLHQAIGDHKTVMIDARWLSLNSDELDELLNEGETGTLEIDRQALNKYTRRPTSIRGITNCFSGQLIYLVSGTRKNIVSGYIPVVGSLGHPSSGQRLVSLTDEANIQFIQDTSQPGVGYQPLVQSINFGALLELRPTVMRDKIAIVDLKATLTSSGERTDDEATNVTFPLAPVVDRNAIDTQELATTLRVPIGKPVLVGGLTHVPPPMRSTQQTGQEVSPQGGVLTEESRQIYLTLELR